MLSLLMPPVLHCGACCGHLQPMLHLLPLLPLPLLPLPLLLPTARCNSQPHAAAAAAVACNSQLHAAPHDSETADATCAASWCLLNAIL
jgi:hypothetical protein